MGVGKLTGLLKASGFAGMAKQIGALHKGRQWAAHPGPTALVGEVRAALEECRQQPQWTRLLFTVHHIAQGSDGSDDSGFEGVVQTSLCGEDSRSLISSDDEQGEPLYLMGASRVSDAERTSIRSWISMKCN